ncbi:hypothetical protein ONS95_005321 [Cadophora gregata]|uniref:uncharacterized protein n=1 Tax=Cadophora gregata TaxID=51156 RepID=UPI0026DAC682|nr:uncharacterized protein ONS95_005321 [Cadophora gregata]KAK0103289.1 hypothetical protein ONS95_005321 [Cadophora gregata]KAK0107481.1 hypothetical protein ONS96_003294 [Cadophora gregata f. sp. sojae]
MSAPLEPIKTNSMPLPPTSPTRPKHLTTRSITEINAPPSLPRIPHSSGHGHNKHHHPHIHTHRHREEKRERERERSGEGDGVGGFGLGIGGSRSEGHTPSESRVASRRESLWDGDGAAGGSGIGGGGGIGRRERVVREGEVKEERERGVLRATELRNALNTLNTHSNTTTRRLDTTYYSVLEKLSTLQNTITSLKELAHLTRGLTEQFSSESQDVVDDVTGQLDGFDGFTDQEDRIKALQDRVASGRSRIKELGARVEVVRERVEGWEVAEGEWQEKTRRRLRVLWVGMSVVVGIVVVVMAVQYTPAREMRGMGNVGLEDGKGEGVKGLNATGLLGVIPDMEGVREGSEDWSLARKGMGERIWEKLREGEGERLGEEDPRLRVFDEL